MKDFDLNKLSGDDAKAIVRSLASGFQATIQNQQTSSQKLISTLVLDLSIERTRSSALKISFPFISMRVEEATDVNSSCKIIPTSIDDYQDDTILKLNDSLEFDNGISCVFITNPAQAGKKMIIKFYTSARVRSGSLVLDANTLNNTMTFGKIQSQNDGYTVLLKYDGGSSINGDVLSFAEVFPSDAFSKTFDGFRRGLVVPSGYQARILGFRTTVKTALTTAASAAPAYSINVSDDITSSTLGVLMYSFVASSILTAGAEREAPIYASNSLPSDRNMAANIVDENKLIYLAKSNVSITAGTISVEVMLRLEKKVGV